MKDGFVVILEFRSISISGTRVFLDRFPGVHALTVGVLSCAETILKRIATAMRRVTRRPPPTAAPMIVPAFICAGAWTITGAAPIPATGLGLGESVGPGVSVGVTDGDAPMRREGVGLGVSVGVCEGVTEEDGVGV